MVVILVANVSVLRTDCSTELGLKPAVTGSRLAVFEDQRQ